MFILRHALLMVLQIFRNPKPTAVKVQAYSKVLGTNEPDSIHYSIYLDLVVITVFFIHLDLLKT